MLTMPAMHPQLLHTGTWKSEKCGSISIGPDNGIFLVGVSGKIRRSAGSRWHRNSAQIMVAQTSRVCELSCSRLASGVQIVSCTSASAACEWCEICSRQFMVMCHPTLDSLCKAMTNPTIGACSTSHNTACFWVVHVIADTLWGSECRVVWCVCCWRYHS